MAKLITTINQQVSKNGDHLEGFTLVLNDYLFDGTTGKRSNEKASLIELSQLISRQKKLRSLKLFIGYFDLSF